MVESVSELLPLDAWVLTCSWRRHSGTCRWSWRGRTKSADEKEKAAEAQMRAAEKREQEAVASKAEAEAAKAEANRKGTEAERMVRDLEAKEALSRREAQAKIDRYDSCLWYSWSSENPTGILYGYSSLDACDRPQSVVCHRHPIRLSQASNQRVTIRE